MKILYKVRPLHFLIVGIVLSFFSCQENDGFKSNFATSEARTWIGPEYWANPMQDWQINKGMLECLVSKKNRNVHMLTEKLDTVKGDVKMRVTLQLNNIQSSDEGVNWVGFSIGSKGKFNDYRDNAIFGKGLNAGVTTNGTLFIDEFPENDKVDQQTQKLLQEGAVLDIYLSPTNDNYELTIAIIDPQSGTIISELSKSTIHAEKVVGDLVLVSHYNQISNEKSVSFRNWEISGSKITTHPEYTFGPILFSQYTLSKGILKLTAQMAPVLLNEEKVHLQILENNSWKTIEEAKIHSDARTATFRIEQWNSKETIPYRLVYKIDQDDEESVEHYWEGTIREDPTDKAEIVIAGFTGNDHLGFPNTDIFNQVKIHNPDVLFFSGDQIYEPNGGFGAQRSPLDKAMLDYLRKWYMYGWAFRDLMKDRPTVSITDDHDVYHGNIWGEGGRAIPSDLGQGAKAQDYGGYKMPAAWVKMVERTQTSHLPDPFNTEPVAQGISTYYTDMVYAGISFAILEDRKFKSAPKALMHEARIRNGWAQNKVFNMEKDGDILSATILGEQQQAFLNQWSTDWSFQSEMKIVLSQTIFANVATLPEEAMSGAIIPTLRILNKGEYPPNDKPTSDLDSNGWPRNKRNNAVNTIRKGFAFHLAGDQHLGSTVQYGIDSWNDSGYAFCVPSISNHWPRRWYPLLEGANRDPEKPKYTGEYKDGFGNKMTVHAASNPTFTNKQPSRLYDRATGYGIVRFNKESRNITIECWPRYANPKLGDTEQYEGWPITIAQEDNYGRKAVSYLPEISIEGLDNPVIEIINEATRETIYSLRINRKSFKAKVFDDTVLYTIRVGEPDKNIWQEKNEITFKKDKVIFVF